MQLAIFQCSVLPKSTYLCAKMAAYQFQLHVIPRKGIFEKFGYIPDWLEINYEQRQLRYQLKREDLLDESDQFEDALTQNWWASTDMQPIEITHRIDKLVGGRRDGDDTCIFWKRYTFGEVDNDASMDINPETGKIEALQFRADLREDDLKFLKAMIALAHAYDWVLMDYKGNLVAPTMPAVAKLIKESYAYKFLSDPLVFLDELKPE